MYAHLDAGLEFPVNLVHDTPEGALTEEDLEDGEFLDDWLALVVDIGPEVELLLTNSVSEVGSLEVLFKLGHRDVEVEIEVLVEHSCDEVDEDAVG